MHAEHPGVAARTAVQFGAGNIGRGFLAQLFHESGLEVVFVDVVRPIVEELNRRRKFPIHIVGPHAETVLIDNVRAVYAGDTERVAEEVARAEIVCTAVGANVIRALAPGIAAGLSRRLRTDPGPLNVLLCENLHDAAAVLRAAVAERLPESEREAVLASTGFVQAVVSRMVPVQTEEDRAADLLAVRVEAYKRLPVDAQAVAGKLPEIVGFELVSNFKAYVERKLYVHNCLHAVLGYAGHAAGYTFGYEAIEDPGVWELMSTVMGATTAALHRRHGFDPAALQAHAADLLERFRNRDLGDTCRRLARDPIRKLAGDDRLVGAARLCEAEAIDPRALVRAIALALAYEDPDDDSAVTLQRSMREDGVDATLQRFCGIEPGERLAANIRRSLKNLVHIPGFPST
jgi:mannitol-1-phosphate 5-dehydrogenase